MAQWNKTCKYKLNITKIQRSLCNFELIRTMLKYKMLYAIYQKTNYLNKRYTPFAWKSNVKPN